MTIQEHIHRLEAAIEALRALEARGVTQAISAESCDASGRAAVHLTDVQWSALGLPGAVSRTYYGLDIDGVYVFRLASAREQLEALAASESAP